MEAVFPPDIALGSFREIRQLGASGLREALERALDPHMLLRGNMEEAGAAAGAAVPAGDEPAVLALARTQLAAEACRRLLGDAADGMIKAVSAAVTLEAGGTSRIPPRPADIVTAALCVRRWVLVREELADFQPVVERAEAEARVALEAEKQRAAEAALRFPLVVPTPSSPIPL